MYYLKEGGSVRGSGSGRVVGTGPEGVMLVEVACEDHWEGSGGQHLLKSAKGSVGFGGVVD